MTRSRPMTVTFTQTDDLTIEMVWGDGAHWGSTTTGSDEEMMVAIGRFIWWSLDDEEAVRINW